MHKLYICCFSNHDSLLLRRRRNSCPKSGRATPFPGCLPEGTSMDTHFDKATHNETLVLRPQIAAKALGVSIATFWRLVKSGHIKTIKIGKRATGVRRSDIERLIENGISK